MREGEKEEERIREGEKKREIVCVCVYVCVCMCVCICVCICVCVCVYVRGHSRRKDAARSWIVDSSNLFQQPLHPLRERQPFQRQQPFSSTRKSKRPEVAFGSQAAEIAKK